MIWLVVSYYVLSLASVELFRQTFLGNTRVGRVPFSLLAMALFVFNYPFLYSLSAGAIPFLIGIPLLVYLLVKWFRLVEGVDSSWRELAKPGLVLSFLALGDPRFAIWAGIPLVILLCYGGLRRGTRVAATKLFLSTALIFLPFLLLTYFTYTLGSGSLVYVSGRTLNLSTVDGFSLAYPFVSYFQFTALTWPAFIYSSPSVLSLSSQLLVSAQAQGSPPSLLLVGSPLIVGLWMVSTLTTFGMGLWGLALRGSARVAPYKLGLLVLFSIAIGGYVPLQAFQEAYIWAGAAPVAGGVFGITFAIPNYALIPVDSLVLFFCLFTVKWMLSDDGPFGKTAPEPARGGRRPKLLRATPRARTVAVAVIIGLLVLANWQLFVAPFTPGQYTPVLSGNGISSSGTLSPSTPPMKWQQAYNFFSSNDNGSYAVAWSQAYGFAYTWSPRTTNFVDPGVSPSPLFYSQLAKLVEEGAYYDTSTLMKDFGVRYYVIDNTSLSYISQLSTFTIGQVYSFFNSSTGLQQIQAYLPDLIVYEDPGAALFQYAQGPPLALPSGSDPLLTQTAFETAFGQMPVTISGAASASNGALEQTPDLVSGRQYGFLPGNQINTGSVYRFDTQVSLLYAPSDGVDPLGGLWFFEGFEGTQSVLGSASSLNVSSATGAGVTSELSLGDFVAPGHVGVPIPEGSGVNISVTLSGRLRGTAPVASIIVVANNQSWRTVGGSTIYSEEVGPGAGTFGANLSFALAPGYYSFDVILQVSGATGWNLESMVVNAVPYTATSLGPYVLPETFPDTPAGSVQSRGTAEGIGNFSISGLSPNEGVVPLNNSWYLVDLMGNSKVTGSNGSVSMYVAGPCRDCSFSSSLSYGDFLTPGHLGIPVPSNTVVAVSVEMRYIANGTEALPAVVAFANNASWKSIGGTEVFWAPLSPVSSWEYINETFLVPDNSTSFEVQFQSLNTNYSSFAILNLSYNFQPIQVTSSFPVTVRVGAAGGGVAVEIAVMGSGIVEVGNETQRVSSTVPEVVSMNGTGRTGTIVDIAVSGLAIASIIVLERAAISRLVLPMRDAFRGYSPLTESALLASPGPNSTLVIATAGWAIPGEAKLSGADFSQTLYNTSLVDSREAYIPGGAVLNIAQIVLAAVALCTLAYLFIYRRMRAGLVSKRGTSLSREPADQPPRKGLGG
jgi:hypothetical protein